VVWEAGCRVPGCQNAYAGGDMAWSYAAHANSRDQEVSQGKAEGKPGEAEAMPG